jgi:hypothetical protein
VSLLNSENAALRAELAIARGEICRLRADKNHLKARLGILSERAWASDRRGIGSLQSFGHRPSDDFPGAVE